MKRRIVSSIVAAMAMGVMAETVNTVTVTKFNQSYPYAGKATVEYTVGGPLPANAVAKITLSEDGTSATFTQNSVVAGANTNVIDFASSFGGALRLTNASFVVTIVADFGGVQLWEGGPYWAECNVGASKPTDFGYYFWWGDTVGYTNTGSAWISVKDGTSISFSSSDVTAGSTYDKSNSTLQSEGWIDSTDNLAAAHDAATAHLGAPWRMPTKEECAALIYYENTTTTFLSRDGVYGRQVTGIGEEYKNRSIFIPYAGVGLDTRFDDGHDNSGTFGDIHSYYWTSTPQSNDVDSWVLYFALNYRDTTYFDRDVGLPVRPVRGPVENASASGVVTYDPVVVVIESVADWNGFCAAVADGSLATEEATIRLANDVGPVSTTVGTAEHPFSGVFDGGLNTLTLALSGTGDYVAPFTRISDATIANLSVAGTVSGEKHCSGLVGLADGANLISNCLVSVAVSSDSSHYGGIVGHGQTSTTELRGCVFSGGFPRLVNATYAGSLWGWNDDGAEVTLIDCLDASETHKPIGIGPNDPVCVSNTYSLASRFYPLDNRWSDDKRGRRAYSVTASEGVELDCGEPLRTYGASGLAFYPVGIAYGGTFYAASSNSVALSLAFTGTPPAGKMHDAFAASAGELAKSGDAWVLTMPAENVVVSATFATAYEIWAAANGVSGAWNETDALGVHNIFRYVFDKPTGAFEDPVLLDIAIEGDHAVVKTPPVSNTVGFAVSVVESSDVAGAAVTRRKPLDATGRTVFPMGNAASRFYRLSATEGDVSLGGVQLWENGPYWAECNVGASEPEDFGYYFWWGDTVGYTRSGGTLGLFGLYTSVTWVSSTGEQMSSSPFSPSSCPTYGKVDSELLSAGYIDSTGNLAPEYDAATAHLGAPWRMPTDAEFAALTNNCIATWITTNGVSGRLVTGTGAYADRSIFLPAPGYGSGSNFGNPNSHGYYWSSTPDSGDSHYAWYLDFNSSLFQRYIYYGRQYGLSVRPVRDAD